MWQWVGPVRIRRGGDAECSTGRASQDGKRTSRAGAGTSRVPATLLYGPGVVGLERPKKGAVALSGSTARVYCARATGTSPPSPFRTGEGSQRAASVATAGTVATAGASGIGGAEGARPTSTAWRDETPFFHAAPRGG